MKQKTTLIFSILISFLSSTWAQDEATLSRYAVFDLMKSISFSFFQEEVDDPIQHLNDHIKKFKDLIEEEEDEIISRYGAISLIQTYSELGMRKEAKATFFDYKNLIANKCYFYIDCYVYLSDLAKLIDAVPYELSRLEIQVSKDLQKSASGLPLLLRNNLLFRSATIFSQASFYHLTGINLPKNQGKKFYIKDSLHKVFLTNFKRLDRYTDFLENQSEMSEVFQEELSRILLKENTSTKLTEGDKQFVQQFVDDMLTDYFQVTQATRAMKLYIKKLRYKNQIFWIKNLKREVTSNRINHLDALTMLATYSKYESTLPTRRKWLDLAQLTAQKLNFEEDNEVTQSIELLVNYNEQKIIDLLEAQGYQENYHHFKDANLMIQLVRKELDLYEYLPEFHSLLYSLNKITLRQANLADFIETVDQKNISDDEQNKLDLYLDLALQEWITLACYTNDKRYEQLPYFYDDFKLKVKLAEKENYQFKKICSKSRSRYLDGKDESIRKGVSHFVIMKRAWKKATVQMGMIGLDVVSIASLVVSAGATALVTAPLKKIIKRQALKHLAKKSYQRVAKRLLAHLTLQLTSAITGSIVFTAAQRLILSAITFGKIPLYEKNKSFMENFGKELVFGGAVFFFLPYASVVGQTLKTRALTSTRLSATLTFQQLLGSAAPIAVENVFFTSIPYVERAIQIARGKEEGKVFRGYGELAHHSIFSLAVSLAFRVKYRELLSRRK